MLTTVQGSGDKGDRKVGTGIDRVQTAEGTEILESGNG